MFALLRRSGVPGHLTSRPLPAPGACLVREACPPFLQLQKAHCFSCSPFELSGHPDLQERSLRPSLFFAQPTRVYRAAPMCRDQGGSQTRCLPRLPRSCGRRTSGPGPPCPQGPHPGPNARLRTKFCKARNHLKTATQQGIRARGVVPASGFVFQLPHFSCVTLCVGGWGGGGLSNRRCPPRRAAEGLARMNVRTVGASAGTWRVLRPGVLTRGRL